MSEFPSLEADELVTKQFLRAEMAGIRTEMAELKHDLTLRVFAVIGASTALLGTLISIA